MVVKLIQVANKIKSIVSKHGSKYITRCRKTNEIDALLFTSLHTQKNISLDTATWKAKAAYFNDLNHCFLGRSNVSRQSISDRSSNIPESFYENVCFDISKLIDSMYNSSESNKSYDICAVDGSDCNLRISNLADGFKAALERSSIA